MKAYGVAHVTLTVPDIRKTKAFYEKLFETTLPMDTQNSFSLKTVGIPCWFSRSRKQYSNDQFDEGRVGLDHVAFEIKTMDELKQVIKRLNEMGVSNAGLEKFAGKYPYVCFRDPDNIQVEFFIPKEL